MFCRIKQFIAPIFLALTAFLCSCMMPVHQPVQTGPMPFKAAIQTLSNDLMDQVKKNRTFVPDKVSVLTDPFIDASTNEIPKVSLSIERIIAEETRRNFKNFELNRVTSANLSHGDYMINGVIRLDFYEPDNRAYYHVSASVVHLKSAKVVAHSDVWISDRELDIEPTQINKDNPMYLKDNYLRGSAAIADSPVGTMADRNYYDALETIAMLVEAETAYGNGDYETALILLEALAERPEGQLMKTYAGLYSIYRRMGRMDMAEKIFDKLLYISVEKHNILTVKFLFDVNSVEFWKDPELKKQYDIWLRQIGRYFNERPYCLRIVGHCSRTGTERYNDELSLDRAVRIQELLQPYFPAVRERSRTIGKGFKETIKGIGTDDERDAIDRRVEFFVVDCD